MRIVAWGTYDLGKPRTRILLRGLQEAGAQLTRCHAPVWDEVADKSMVAGLWPRAQFALRWLSRYPGLIARYLRLPEHDAVVVGYLGQLDVLVLWPLARLRGVPIVWDEFISLYNTVVEDRKLISERHPVAHLLRAWEWLACRAADVVVMDTEAHARYLHRTFGCSADRTRAVFVGAETDVFYPGERSRSRRSDGEPFTILFYGQFIPLHGIETIVEAARLLADRPYRWQLIGRGQDEARVRAKLEHYQLSNVSWIPWVPYESLRDWVDRADVCLGIFDAGEKASNVIPNKVYQVLAVGRPLITRDSPAIRELVTPDTPWVSLVPAANPAALADAVVQLAEQPCDEAPARVHARIRERITPRAIGESLLRVVSEAAGLKS